jgi:hypothetical protein
MLSALMCDGMGWFSQLDYKRMLLLFDRVHYLLPRELVEFRDADGRTRFMIMGTAKWGDDLFQTTHAELDAETLSALQQGTLADLGDETFVSAVAGIPPADRLYTWRVANADGDIGNGASLGLSAGDDARAHALLLNKFLLTADQLGCVPITGKPYIQQLIAAKYRRGVPFVEGDAERMLAPVPEAIARNAQLVTVALCSALVPDEELERRTERELLDYKRRHADLFASFHAAIKDVTLKTAQLPKGREFFAALGEFERGESSKELRRRHGELRAAWRGFFRSAAAEAAKTTLGLTVAPVAGLARLVTAGAPALSQSARKLLATATDQPHHALQYLLHMQEEPIIRVRA